MDFVSKIQSQFTVDDVQAGRAEAVSVVSEDELGALLEAQIAERTSALEQEVQSLQDQLANAEGGGGLEQAAAEAALEAEAEALEAKAQAEQRAAEAESRATELADKLAAAEANAGDPAQITELEAKVAALTAEVTELKKKVEDEEVDAGGPVTDDDRRKARRVAEAFLDDVFTDDEDKTNAAIKDGKFREVFAKELKVAKAKFIKRVKAHVRGETDYWEECLKAGEGKEW